MLKKFCIRLEQPSDILVLEQPFTDISIQTEDLLSFNEMMQPAKVIGRSRNNSGETIGTYYTNPFINFLLYDLEFPSGSINRYAANITAENMYA